MALHRPDTRCSSASFATALAASCPRLAGANPSQVPPWAPTHAPPPRGHWGWSHLRCFQWMCFHHGARHVQGCSLRSRPRLIPVRKRETPCSGALPSRAGCSSAVRPLASIRPRSSQISGISMCCMKLPVSKGRLALGNPSAVTSQPIISAPGAS